MSAISTRTFFCILTVIATAGCVKQVTPLGPSRLIVNGTPSDTIVRNDSGAVTRDTSLGFRLTSLAPVQTDGFFLPLASSDGLRLAWQQESNFNWPLLTALPMSSLSARGVIAVREMDDTKPSHIWEGSYMLGRSCNSEGVLVESPQADGARWIGVLPWTGGEPQWLLHDAAVNAFASIGPRGELAWSHRNIGQREFSVTVDRPEGKFEWPSKPNESWLLPIVATDGIFAARLRDGVLELAYLPLRAGQNMTTLESRPAIIFRNISLRGSERLAYQCIGSLSPDRAVLADGSLLFFHPDLGRIVMWQPSTDTLTPLPFGTLSASATSSKQLLLSFRDRLATLSLPVDSIRGPVTLLQEPWIARAPSGEGSGPGQIMLFLPTKEKCNVAILNLE